MIVVRDLIYDYPSKRALFGLSFDVAPATITALVGPNGAGKTTLMRCLAALDAPFSGTVEVDGIDVVEHPREARARIGFLQDFYGLYDQLSVKRCLMHHAAMRGVPGAEQAERARETAAAVGLTERLEQRAGTLSRGLRQRLAIGQAIIHRPRILLLDEPAAGLDPDARAELSDLLLALKARGMTLIVSSHILVELEDYSSHLMVIRDGRLAEHGPLAGSAADGRRLRLDLASPVAALGQVLAGQAGVHGVEAAAEGAAFLFRGDLGAQATLLAALVAQGLPVAALAEERASLTERYRLSARGAAGSPVAETPR
ncbi:ABC transporter ATP-binding protein [Zavarzinia sp. CC-PAN008]|uniref:ABC transporter ATP-binding protein n=1 Tax=Zavarzinia sp. CC-PAN008 TaxID=3243332 RepID=UPI003F747F35